MAAVGTHARGSVVVGDWHHDAHCQPFHQSMVWVGVSIVWGDASVVAGCVLIR